jgi:hypothetical protein
MGILSFHATTITPAALRALGSGFKAGGQFIVRISFDPIDAVRYEYRQYIKGTAGVTAGRFNGTPSLANWVATGTRRDASNSFAMPGGLKTSYREDAEKAGGVVQRFGYRSSPAVLRTGLEDQYLPTQTGGAEYRLRDTWGLAGDSRPVGLRVEVDIVYKGVVIDTFDSDKVVLQRQWGVHIDDIIT